MTEISRDVIELLNYLLPGFVAAAVLYSLTPLPRPEPFERIVQALIYTIIIQVLLVLVPPILIWLGTWTFVIGEWNDRSQLGWSVVLALGLGAGLARMSNHDSLHTVLRHLKFTQQTANSSEWYGVFSRNRGYVVLHLPGERRLFGWPEEWPSVPGRGHFLMSHAEWLVDEHRTSLEGVERILVDATEVSMVEFLVDDTVSSSKKDMKMGDRKAPTPPPKGPGRIDENRGVTPRPAPSEKPAPPPPPPPKK